MAHDRWVIRPIRPILRGCDRGMSLASLPLCASWDIGATDFFARREESQGWSYRRPARVFTAETAVPQVGTALLRHSLARPSLALRAGLFGALLGILPIKHVLLPTLWGRIECFLRNLNALYRMDDLARGPGTLVTGAGKALRID